MIEEGRRPQDCQPPIDAGLAVMARALKGHNDRVMMMAAIKNLAQVEWGAGKEIPAIIDTLGDYLDTLEQIPAYCYTTGGTQSAPTICTYQASDELVKDAALATVARTFGYALQGWEGTVSRPVKILSRLFEANELAKRGRRNASKDEVANGKADDNGTIEFRHFLSPWDGEGLNLEGWKFLKEDPKDRAQVEGRYVWTHTGSKATSEQVSADILAAASRSRF